MNSRGLGLLVIEAAFEEEQAADAVADLLDLLEQLSRRPVTDAELSLGKVALGAKLQRATRSNFGLARLAAELYAAGSSSTRLRRLPVEIASITAADVQRVARKYLRPRDVEIGLVGSAHFAQELPFLGKVEVYSVDRR